ncbi:MAG TPA: hypothetical protein VFU19_13150 [Iamia sp.]|nr:hypothetical protein [Iamia sp.]
MTRRRSLAVGFLLADLALVLAVAALASEPRPDRAEEVTATTKPVTTTSTTSTTSTTTTSTTTTLPGAVVLSQPVRFCAAIDIDAIAGGPTSAEAIAVRDRFYAVVRGLDERRSEGLVALIFVRAPDGRRSQAIAASEVVAEMLKTQFGSVFGVTVTRPFWAGGEEGLVYVDAYVSPGRDSNLVPPDPSCPPIT